ncbi:MAG: M23 family metallopeptidase [Cytophagaceae bacterium]|nr:M23 family metallopeptidase [Cytophagaceae bacterium]MDW8456154.1 peptidoglycan DD-metalloendopeptidase family protein [Cytophagaceae bacterium]
MRRKTLSERLTDKYQLIIRSEENFAEKYTFNITWAKVIALLFFFLVLAYFIFWGIHSFVDFLTGGDNRRETERKLLSLHIQIDSLEQAVRQKDEFVNSFKKILEGQAPKFEDSSGKKALQAGQLTADAEEINFRKKIEKEISAFPTYKATPSPELYFNTPVKGKAIVKNVADENMKAVFITVKEKTPVHALDDGLIVALYKDSLVYNVFIQHKNGLLSAYSGLNSVSKTVRQKIKRNEPFGWAQGNVVKFEMWYEGFPIEPQKFVQF